MRPATVNWMESLAAPLPLFFHCSSLSLRIFILSASDVLAPTSTLLFYQDKAVPQSAMRKVKMRKVCCRGWWNTAIQNTGSGIYHLLVTGWGGLISRSVYDFRMAPELKGLSSGAVQCPFFFRWFTPAAIFHLNFTLRNEFPEPSYLLYATGPQDLLQNLVIFLYSVF